MRWRLSLRARLLTGLLLAVLAAAPFTVLGVYLDAHHELDELFDAHLEQLARLHLAVESSRTVTPPSAQHPYSRKILVRHTWADGRPNALWDSEPAHFPPELAGVEGLGDFDDQSTEWRYVGLWSEDRRHHVLILQDHDIRNELASYIAWRVSLQSLFELPLLGLIVVVLTALTLRPLRNLVSALKTPDPLQVKLPPAESMTPELAVVVTSFDHLLGRFRELLDRERQFATLAAHELRTPLAGLSAQLQVLEATDSAGQHALTQARQAARHLGSLIDRLLLLARMDRDQVTAQAESIHLHDLVVECAGLIQDNWPHRRVRWRIAPAEQPSWQVDGDPTLLRMMILNLFDNACKHGPTDLEIRAEAHRQAGQVMLVIEDNGPGIPAQDRDRIQQRFSRSNTQTAGLGLGLAVATEIASLHGGSLTLSAANPTGLRVEIVLPDRPAAEGPTTL